MPTPDADTTPEAELERLRREIADLRQVIDARDGEIAGLRSVLDKLLPQPRRQAHLDEVPLPTREAWLAATVCVGSA